MLTKEVNANSSIILLTANKFCQDNIKVNALHIGSELENQLIEGNLVHYSNSTVKHLRNQCFRGLTSLVTATFEQVESIGATCFNNCNNLESITIKTDTVATIPSASYIVSGKTITIYVPYLQINNYLTNTSWKTLVNYGSCVFKPYETDHVIKDNIYYMYLNTNEFVDLMGYQGITTIKNKAFNDPDYNKVSVKYVKIPPSVTTIEDGAFNTEDEDLIIYGYCGTAAETYAHNNGIQFIALDLEVNDNGIVTKFNPQYGSQSLLRNITIPDKITKIKEDGTIYEVKIVGIGDQAFQSNVHITTLVLPNAVTSIGFAAFEGCANLETVTLSDPNERSELCSIGSVAFQGCANLTEFFSLEPSSEDDVLTLKQGAFKGCSKLTKLQIEYTKVDMGSANDHFNDHNTDFTIYCYENSTIYTYAKDNSIKIRSLNLYTNEDGYLYLYTGNHTNLTIPQDIKGVIDKEEGELVFYNFSSLESVTFEGAIDYIGSYSFANCPKLQSIRIPNSTQTYTIEEGAFKNSTQFKGILDSEAKLSKSSLATFVNKYAFENTAIETFLFNSNINTIYEKTFYNCKSLINVNGYIIDYIENYAFYGCEALSTVNNMFSSQNGIVFDPYAFYGCKELTSLGSDCKIYYAEDYAFYGCKKLESVTFRTHHTSNALATLENGVFEGCIALTSCNGTDSIGTLGEGVFKDCTALRSFTFNNSITTIPKKTFYGCTNLLRTSTDQLQLPSNLETIDEYAFANCSGIGAIIGKNNAMGSYCTIPLSVKNINNYAFANCSSIKSINIYNLSRLSTIGFSAFEGCSNLQQIGLPFVGNTRDNSTEGTHFGFIFGISGYANHSANMPEKLTTVTIDSGGLKDDNGNEVITTIAANAFRNCIKIENIELYGINTIGSRAFGNCQKLQEITLPFIGNTKNGTQNTHFGYIFGAPSYGNNVAVVPTTLTKVTILDGNISDYAFSGCTKIETIILQKEIKIGEYAFQNCTGINVIDLSNATEIGLGALKGCSGITTITIPFTGKSNTWETNYDHFGYIFGASSIGMSSTNIPTTIQQVILTGTEIKDYAFSNCGNKIEQIIVEPSVTYVGVQVFKRCYLTNIDFEYETGMTQIYVDGEAFYSDSTSPTAFNITIKCTDEEEHKYVRDAIDNAQEAYFSVTRAS